MPYRYIFYIILGFIPSIVWLSFYLKKDAHPEPKKTVLKIFLYGIISACFAALIELALLKTASFLNFNQSSFFFILFYHFILIAFVEETIKYLVVKEKVLKHYDFDEPTDAMIYMIVAALGFAALENILVILPLKKIADTLSIIFFRFLSATFLHALASAIVGYFLAFSLLKSKVKKSLLFSGIVVASFLHGLYNIFIIKINSSFFFIGFLIILLISMALFVSSGFKKLKKIKSVCKF